MTLLEALSDHRSRQRAAETLMLAWALIGDEGKLVALKRQQRLTSAAQLVLASIVEDPITCRYDFAAHIKRMMKLAYEIHGSLAMEAIELANAVARVAVDDLAASGGLRAVASLLSQPARAANRAA